VEVQAGSFEDCIRTEIWRSGPGASEAYLYETVWYCPCVGMVKLEWSSGDTMELVDYMKCPDLDGDGWFDASCNPASEIGCGGDCMDNIPEVHPLATEICSNILDDDCDGLGDAWDTDCCVDADGDNFTDIACGGADCDDTEFLASPGMQEIQGDGIDNDCDGQIDETCFIESVM